MGLNKSSSTKLISKKPQPSGVTLMDADESSGLIPKHITLKRELDEYEQENIFTAQQWAVKQINKDILSENFVRKLHKRMFDKTWKWAGKFRKTEKSIGIDPARIGVELYNLLNDVKTWQEFKTYPLDEQAARLHHRMVLIHPFPNGNGRHARLFTDIFLQKCGAEPFSWGSINLSDASQTRRDYITALQAADRREYEHLLDFIRS